MPPNNLGKVAQKISDGLVYLLTQAKETSTWVDVNAHHDLFCVCMCGPSVHGITTERADKIQAKMIELGWLRDGGQLQFKFYT